MASGYVYVLANSSMPGLVKIGKTTRLPSERADELSGVTGVATPFIVVYEDYFDDCDAAESFVHTKLAINGLRLSENREFFRASVSDVVKTLASIQSTAGRGPSVPERLDELLTPDGPEFDGFELSGYSAPRPWDALMEEADNHYCGSQGYIQDYAEAFKFYRDAARLGSPMAYERLGDMYQAGEGIREDSQRALEFYKEGAKKGNHFCFAGMTMIFIENGHLENARKSLSKLIAGGEADRWETYIEYPDRHIAIIQTIVVRASRRSPGMDRDLISLVRPYIPQVINSIQKKVHSGKLEAYPSYKEHLIKLITTLEMWFLLKGTWTAG